jgi:hypothetical protein
MPISGVSINRFHVVHAYRWNTTLPMVAACVPAPPCPAPPCPSDPCVCKRACACVRGRMHASAYAAGIRRGRPCRSGSRRCSISAPRCCGRSPPPGAPTAALHGLPPGTEWAHPVPDIYHEPGSAPCQICAGTGLALRARPLRTCTGTKRTHPSSVSTGTKLAHPHGH